MTQRHSTATKTLGALTAATALVLGTSLPAAAEAESAVDKSAFSLTSLEPDLTTTNIDVNRIIDTALETPGYTGKWFVELSATPVIEGGALSKITAQHDAFEKEASDAGVSVDDNFFNLWNGVTVFADSEELRAVARLRNVVGIFPVLEVERPETIPGDTSAPEQIYAKDMTGASLAEDYGADGHGVKIGIIDTGIDYDNTVFGGTGTPNTTPFPSEKVTVGYDFVGDDFNADPALPGYNLVATPDNDPDDCGGHGTHVAGIAAGNDTASDFTGVAPKATLGAYRVFGCVGSTTSEVILHAMERAANDGMQIVNISIGASGMVWPNYPTAVAADRLSSAGVVVTVSQGNVGDKGIFYGSAPGIAEGAIAVGSVDNTHVQQFSFDVGGKLYGYTQAGASPIAPQEGSFELATYPAGKELGGVDLPGEPFKDKVVVVFRGGPSFHATALAAQNDGAAGVIIVNNAAGTINVAVAGPVPITIPVVSLTMLDGLALHKAITEAPGGYPLTLAWSDKIFTSQDPVGGNISSFSSWGVAGDLTLKPDVLAPGGNIFSAYPLDAPDANGSGFMSLGGTSMASPHVAGAAALLLQLNPKLAPEEIRALLQNNADPIDNHKAAVVGTWLPEAVFRQGAGLINIPASLTKATSGRQGATASASLVTPSKINLLDGDKIETTNLTITNNTDHNVTYTMTIDDSPLTVYGRNKDANTKTQIPIEIAQVTDFSMKKLTVPAFSSRTIAVTINEPLKYWSGDAVKPGTFYGGYVVLSGSDHTVQRVPFFGMKGDYETDRPFLLANWMDITGYPASALEALGYDPYAPVTPPATFYSVGSGNYAQAGANRPFTMIGDDIPALAVSAENPIQSLTANVYHANEDGSKGKLLTSFAPLYRSNSFAVTNGHVIISRWNGTYQASKDPTDIATAPNGRYLFEVVASRGVGQAKNGKNTDEWVTVPFVLDAPKAPGIDLHNDWSDVVAAVIAPVLDGQILVGDWDGDGKDTLAFHSGNTFTYSNSRDTGKATSIVFGRPGDVPLAGDWDGDGKDSFAIRRGGDIYVRNSLSGGGADITFTFGRATDIPFAGDFDGDGKDTIAVVRDNVILAKNRLAGGSEDARLVFGRASDEFYVGDWDGDGTDSFAVRRDNTFFLKNTLSGGNADDVKKFGSGGSRYYFGDWNDDGVDTPAVLR
ncbi:MAG: S8 family serine peptidase [Ancrocorticia sp.]